MTISYVTIGTDDLEAATRFYDAALAPLGMVRQWTENGWAGYGHPARPDAPGLLLCKPHDGKAARAGNGIMVGLHADDARQVDAFHAAALAQGGTDEGAPGPRPYGEGYYLAYVRDPVGNKLSAFCKTYKPEA